MMNSTFFDFRTLLSFLAQVFGSGKFTARDVHSLLVSSLREMASYRPDFAYKALLRFRIKLISNDLRRLYFMGLLKRRRVKRRCKTRSGKTCFRGYEYRYSISSQGWKYLKYLENPDVEDAKGMVDLLVLQMIERKVPKELREILWEFYKAYLSGRRGFRRFSSSKSRFWDKLIDAKLKLMREEWMDIIKELWEIVKVLVRKNEALRRENAELRKMLRKTYTTLEKLTRLWRKNPQIVLNLLSNYFNEIST